MARFLTNDVKLGRGEGYAVVARGADGRYAVVTAANQLQFFDPDGQPIGEPMPLPGGYDDPQIVASGDGYLVFNIAGSFEDGQIYGQRLDADGQSVGEPFIIHERSELESLAAIGLPNGDVALLFRSDDSLLGYVVSADGQETNFFIVGDPGSPTTLENLEVSANGGFIVTYSSIGGAGRAAFTDAGQPDTSPGGLDPAPMTAELPDGGYVLIEIRSGILVAQEFNGDGSPRTDEFLIDDRAGNHLGATLAVNADGTWSVAWTEQVGGETEVYLRRFDAFSADAAATGGDDDLIGTDQDDTLSGLDGRDVLFGLEGNDTMDGGAGADQMYGGLGDDIYYVDHVGDVVEEFVNAGFDQVFASVSYALDNDQIERLVLTGSADIDATGDGRENRLVGNSGNNKLDGREGADQMAGGLGDDIYWVDNVDDRVWEFAGEGFDQIWSSVSYSLEGGRAERLVLTGTANLNADGNAQANRLVGNSGNNVLNGLGGADQMAGHGGDDIYYVDNVRDRVWELAGEGFDQIWSTVSYSLADTYVERLVLDGAGDIDATGNTQANRLVGNSGDNVLDGRQGADQMAGRFGDDTYYVDNLGDVVWEFSGQGHDTVVSSVDFDLTGVYAEDVILTGSADLDVRGNSLANVLTGNDGDNVLDGEESHDILFGGLGDDTLIGGSGDDVLNGGLGADRLDGGAGADRFVFSKAEDSALASSDVITGLDSADRIDLSAIDANGLDDGDDAFTLVDAFSNERGQATLEYDADAGRTALLMDIDGDGQADMRIWIEGEVTTLDTSLF
ncbi:calcium-binding protein [Brevundimonas lutea]|uniref:calcium-binding protein n=1 Tax=Brevundimonas lutea TaxID=2293980 RepID=UPI000F03CA47|nr:calcium-binding protein [Brevundimonas lutea]